MEGVGDLLVGRDVHSFSLTAIVAEVLALLLFFSENPLSPQKTFSWAVFWMEKLKSCGIDETTRTAAAASMSAK